MGSLLPKVIITQSCTERLPERSSSGRKSVGKEGMLGSSTWRACGTPGRSPFQHRLGRVSWLARLASLLVLKVHFLLPSSHCWCICSHLQNLSCVCILLSQLLTFSLLQLWVSSCDTGLQPWSLSTPSPPLHLGHKAILDL